jgi:hypothetical protein
VKRVIMMIAVMIAACGGRQAAAPTPSNVAAPEAPRSAGPRAGSGSDSDGDGIVDDDDKCPSDPEDFDSFEDSDGCPDPDNDRDGILDVDDMCPNNAENANGKADDDGCPD